MKRFYFFKSSEENDVLSGITVFTTNVDKAFTLANIYFTKQKCKGKAVILAV